ncbi:MAG: DMT family transporter [Dehalococcoidia bacterium]|nr:MAG: DMT family transporter [Dehalococcoidia bacterium]
MTRLAALLGVLSISFSAIFVRLADVSPSTVAFFRASYAIPVLFLIWRLGRGQDYRSTRDRQVAFASGLFLAMDLAFWHQSIRLIGAGLATVLVSIQVVFVGLAAWAMYRERPTGLALFTIPIIFGGVALMSGLGRPDAYGDDPLGGVIFGIFSGVAYALFLLVFRASNRGLAPSAGPLLDATVGVVVGSLIAGLIDPDFDLGLSWPAHGWLLCLALVVQVGGWLFIAAALPRLPALETSVMLLLQPMATVLWATLIFAVNLSLLQWAGAALVLGGIGALTLRGSVERPVPTGSP